FSPDADFPVINCEKGVCHLRVTLKKPDSIDYIEGGERVNMVADGAKLKMKTMSDGTLSKCMKGLAKITFEEDGFSLTAKGVSAHGSTPDKGENAILKLLFAAKSSNECIADLYDAFFKTDGSGLGVACADEKSGALTMNLGYARTQGSEISFGLDIRYPVSVKEETLLAEIKKALPSAVLTVEGRHLPLFVPADSELVTALMSAYNEVTGENAVPISIGGATYARAFPNAVAFGPIFPDEESKIHQTDECVRLSSLVRSAEIYKKALEKLAF
ncbi:MAG: M20/M25/M40 family metallo-hydrolase, partial [Clostridia bacterium]|nr:M20/M25/M40 family metallo-hydrolase [Clostridia bacterium]